MEKPKEGKADQRLEKIIFVSWNGLIYEEGLSEIQKGLGGGGGGRLREVCKKNLNGNFNNAGKRKKG